MMDHTKYKGFDTAFWNGVMFLFLTRDGQIDVFSMGDGRLHNWGAWMSKESFKKRFNSKKDEPLKPLD